MPLYSPWSWGLANAEVSLDRELGGLGDSPSSGSCKSWDTQCVERLDTLFYCWIQLGVGHKKCLHSPSFRLLEGSIILCPCGCQTQASYRPDSQTAARKVCSQPYFREKLGGSLFILLWASRHCSKERSHSHLKPPLCYLWSWGTLECWALSSLRDRWFMSQFLK